MGTGGLDMQAFQMQSWTACDQGSHEAAHLLCYAGALEGAESRNFLHCWGCPGAKNKPELLGKIPETKKKEQKQRPTCPSALSFSLAVYPCSEQREVKRVHISSTISRAQHPRNYM